jgi:hypothetical protein
VRRLLQFATFLFVLVTFLAPLSECFDRWDTPGLSNDTEFAVFALILLLCLVLLVSRLVAACALLIHMVLLPRFGRCRQQPASQSGSGLAIFVPPLCPPPLRI